ncbi:MAG: acyltransferase family protein [Alphaproteobacteria bacterium]
MSGKAGKSQSVAVPARLHGLDALRGGLLLLGVVQHATAPYIPIDHYSEVLDIRHSMAIGCLSFVSHIFRMIAFFVLAGLFARMSLHRLGTIGFARDRFKRIFVPLVVGWVAIVPAMVALFGWALVRSYGLAGLQGELGPQATIHADGIPLQHLWFLYILSLLCALTVLAKLVMDKLDPAGRLSGMAHGLARRALSTPFAILALAAPTTLVLATTAGWTVSSGVPTPNVGLLYVNRSLVIYGAAFAAGWAMHRQLDLAQTWARWWPWCLPTALVLSLVCYDLIGYHVHAPAPSHLDSLVEATLYAVTAWTWTFALIGLSLRFMSRASAARRYLADSSYWIYLVHPPLVLWLGDAIRTVGWPAPLKLVFTVGVAMLILLASYQLIVRHSFIGAWLSGKRREPAVTASALTGDHGASPAYV